ncbi:hypothetical protein IWX50DRAFT_712443 [Phyllosticta citricarpa]
MVRLQPLLFAHFGCFVWATSIPTNPPVGQRNYPREKIRPLSPWSAALSPVTPLDQWKPVTTRDMASEAILQVLLTFPACGPSIQLDRSLPRQGAILLYNLFVAPPDYICSEELFGDNGSEAFPLLLLLLGHLPERFSVRRGTAMSSRQYCVSYSPQSFVARSSCCPSGTRSSCRFLPRVMHAEGRNRERPAVETIQLLATLQDMKDWHLDWRERIKYVKIVVGAARTMLC